MKLRWFFRRAVVLLAGLVFLLPAASASAHGHVMVGDYELEIGFRNEPALQDELNGLELAVQNTKTSGPVTGLEDTLQAEIIFGASSRVLKIEPVPDEDGAYTAAFIPSEVGDYTWHIFGKIEDTPVDVSMTSSPTTFDSVGPRGDLSFPGEEASLTELRLQVQRARETAVVAIVVGGIGLLLGIISLVMAATRGRGISVQ